jgi:alanyl-tRNA synthetase
MTPKPTPFMSAAAVRRAYLEFFRERGHTIVPSSSLVPGNDPTLLFTNAGMVQFKDVFLGKDARPYVRATSSQRCVRAGGKHNDLENVGYTARHHTFFEMLGNFSFGDYFKRDAIRFAWDFLTGTLGLDPARLWVTVYADDDEAADIWLREVGVPKERFTRLGEKSNFWAMGDTGPCGPCTEIFYDHGAHIPGGPPGSPDEDGDRYVEIWNLVFMQYERDTDGRLTPLPKPSVDTGAGLERVSAVMQGVHNNYDIDLFVDLIREAARLVGATDLTDPSLRVIADHIRACSFLIADGVVPSNEGRGYVLRRIARRAMRHGQKFGAGTGFFAELEPALEAAMGEAYPELVARGPAIREVLKREGEQFARTLETGMALLEAAIAALPTPAPAAATVGGSPGPQAAGAPPRAIDGETVFKLYDTYGFPVDLTADVARERGLTIDLAGFEAAMEAQRGRARAASRFNVDLRGGAAQLDARSEFRGYDATIGEGRVVALLRGGERVAELHEGEEGEVILDATPFYAESGGQVGDSGELVAAQPGGAAGSAAAASNTAARFIVTDTQKRGSGAAHAHIGKLLQGSLREGERVVAQVDAAQRRATALNHSATHLLHAVLRQVLGAHVQQKGSLVSPQRLRFDFSHFQQVTAAELSQIEHLVNAQIRANAPARTDLMDYDAAVASGAMALFGEKYESKVRVLRLGDFSVELCGGTHVGQAGDIGLFKIVSEGGVAAGVRRIEAVTGEGALAFVDASEAVVREVAGLVRGARDDVVGKVRDALERIRQLERENRQLKDKLAQGGGGTDLAAGAVDVGGVKVVAAQLEGADVAALRAAVDQLKDRLKSAVVVLASVEASGKVLLVAGVTADLTARVKAGELVGSIAAQLGGKGGGRPDFAQAGASNAAALPQALADVLGRVREKLAA